MAKGRRSSSSSRYRGGNAVGFYTKKHGRRKVVHPITQSKGRSKSRLLSATTVLRPLSYFQEKAKELERKAKRRTPAPKPPKAQKVQKPKQKQERKAEPKPEAAEAKRAPKEGEQGQGQGKPTKIRVRRARGKEGVLPKEMARRILLARMKRLYPDSDYEVIVENMMDDYDPMVTFNENMASLARSERWRAFARAFEYATDAEVGQFNAAEARDFEREELYRQLDEMIGRIYEEHPLEFQEYLVQRGIAEAS